MRRLILQDYAICIAVVHHFSTRENRIHALRELRRIVRTGGQVLVTVWAFEQEKKKYTEQDVMIKWHLQKRFDQTQNIERKPKSKAPIPTSSNSRTTGTLETDSTSTTPAEDKTTEAIVASSSATNDSSQSNVLERYYHLFKKGELDELALEVGGFSIVQSLWDVDNWYLLLERTEK